jgi:hypothetical protein
MLLTNADALLCLQLHTVGSRLSFLLLKFSLDLFSHDFPVCLLLRYFLLLALFIIPHFYQLYCPKHSSVFWGQGSEIRYTSSEANSTQRYKVLISSCHWSDNTHCQYMEFSQMFIEIRRHLYIISSELY